MVSAVDGIETTPLLRGHQIVNRDEATLAAPSAEKRATKTGLHIAIITSWNVTIGVGILALPRAFALVGFVPGIVGLALMCFICQCTFEMLGRAMRDTGQLTYGGTMRAACGPMTSWATDFVIWAFLYGVLIVYSQVVAEIMVDVLRSWDHLPIIEDPDLYFDNRRLFVLVFGFGVFLPLALLPSLEMLRHVSLLATMSMCYVVIVLLVRLAGQLRDNGGEPCIFEADSGRSTINGTAAACASPWGTGETSTADGSGPTFMDYASAISTFSFALTTHTALPPILSELQDPSPRRATAVIGSMVWFSFVLYLIVGMAGYFLFGDRQCPLITNAFGPDDRYMQAGQIFVVACVSGGHPVQNFQARISFERITKVDTWLFVGSKPRGCFSARYLRQATTSAFLVITSTVVAFLVEDLNAVIDLAGAFGGGATAFILPVLAYTSTTSPAHHSWPQKMLGWRGACVVAGTLLTTFLTVLVIYDLTLGEDGIEDGPNFGDELCGANVLPGA